MTTIRFLDNHSRGPVALASGQNRIETLTYERSQVDMEIPACETAEAFSTGHLELEVYSHGTSFRVWVAAGSVRLSEGPAWRADAPPIGGEPQAGGDRQLIVQAGGKVVLREIKS